MTNTTWVGAARHARRVVMVAAACGLMACWSKATVPCAVQADCARFGAVCVERQCRFPEELDGGDHLADTVAGPPAPEPVVDLGAAPDLSPAPDLGPSCGAQQSCPLELPICGAQDICRPCVASDRAACAANQLLAPRCDVATGACAACRADVLDEPIDCPEPGLGVCGVDGSCRQDCSTHGDCASGICDPRIVTQHRASCVRADEILHVRPITGCVGPHAGSPADPLCSLDDAIALRPAGGYIRVLAGNTGLSRIKTPISQPYVIVGEGALSAPNELVAGVSALRVAASVVAGGRLYLEGLRIETTGAAGLTCDGSGGTASLVLRGVDLVGAQSTAVRAKGCDVDLDRVRMREGGDGLSHDGGTLRVTNTYIYRNAGVAFTTTSASVATLVAHLTVADNVPAAVSSPGAFACGGAVTIRNSIVWGNRVAGGAAYSGACAFRYSSVDPQYQGGTGNNHLAPAFTPGNFQLGTPSDYHLKGPLPAGVNPCCIAQAESVAGVAVDWDGQPRPNGLPEIGADEL